MKRVVLLRHGRTAANDGYLYCGSTDLPLSEGGREALKALAEEGGYPELRDMRVFTSGMLRTEETLRILYGDTDHTIVPGLREMDFGAFEMHSYEQLKDDPAYRQWCDGDNEANIAPGGESGELMRRRVLENFWKLYAENESFLLVSHGGPIAAIMAELFTKEDKNRFQWQPENGKGYLIETDGTDRTWRAVPEKGAANGG